MSHPVVEFQILSKTPDETAEFFQRMFGWKVNSDNPLGYRRIDTGSKDGIQGGIWPAPPQAQNFVQLFVRVEDVKAAASQAAELGGKVIIPPSTLPEGDEMAVLMDPHGMPFAVCHFNR